MNAINFTIPKGNEPMKFTDEFMKATRQVVIMADLGQVERQLAEELCRKQDQQVREKLVSP